MTNTVCLGCSIAPKMLEMEGGALNTARIFKASFLFTMYYYNTQHNFP